MIASPLAIQPAGAIPANDSVCTFVPAPGGVTSAQISWYPGNPGSMSGLEVGCVFRNDTAPGASMISPSFTIHDSEFVSYHNGAAKPVSLFANSPAAGTTTLTLTGANNRIVGIPVGTVNRIISGPGLAPRTVVTTSAVAGANLTITLNRPTVDADPNTGGFQPITTAMILKLENSIARSVTDAVYVAPGGFSSVQANLTAADIGLSVSGTGVPVNTVITAVGPGSQAQTNNAFGAILPTVSIGGTQLVSTVRQITGTTTNAAGVRVSSTGGLGSFVASDIGLPITGRCDNLDAIPANDTVFPANVVITATPSQANADTTGGLPASQTGCTVVVGQSNANAPTEGDIIASQGVQLNLNPALVAGSDDCTNEQPEGFALTGKWYNPGAFQGSGATNTQPGPSAAAPATPGTKAVGQIFFDTSAADFSAYVIERKVLTAGDPNGQVHYDVVFPFAPTGLALCPASANSPGLSFLLDVEGTTASQSALATGTGRPGTGQVRNVQATASGGYTTTVFVDSQGAVAFTPASSFQRLCAYPAGFPNPINFQCGAG